MLWTKIYYGVLFAFCFLWVVATSKSTDYIKGPPKLLSERKSQQKSVNEGKDVKLSCPVVGNPQPIYEWWKDSEAIPEDSWERFRSQRNSLKIKQVSPEDSGMYTCKGVNGFGNEQFNIYLHVQASSLLAPTGDELKIDEVFPISGSTITKLTGQNVQFKCLVSGFPEPDVTWFKNGRIMSASDHYDAINFEDRRRTQFYLKLSQLSMWDSGNYSCEVINIHGTITVNWTLNIVSPASQDKPDVFPLQLSNQTVVSGDEAVLRCKGSWDSEISPKVKWLRRITLDQLGKLPENQTFAYKGNYYQVLHPSELLVLDSGIFITKLVIRDVELHDSGIYVCLATNRFGLNFREASLQVIENDSNFGHLVLIVTLSAVVFVILVVSIYCGYRKKKAKRLPSHNTAINSAEMSKVQMESYVGRPLLPPPLVSDRVGAELQPRYVIYPPTGLTPHSRTEEKMIFHDSSSKLHHPSIDQMSIPSKSNESNTSQNINQNHQVQPIVVYQDAPRSMYISATPNNRYHIQNFNVI